VFCLQYLTQEILITNFKILKKKNTNNSKNDNNFKNFLKVITSDKLFDEFPGGQVFDATLVKQNGDGTIVLHRGFDKPIAFKEKDYSKLREFIVSNGFPLVEEISAQNFQRYVDVGLPLSVSFFDFFKERRNAKYT